MAPLPVVIMPRRKKDGRNRAAEGDQPGGSGEAPAESEPAASRSPALAADASAPLGAKPTAVPTPEGRVHKGGGDEADRAEVEPTGDPETRSRLAFFGRSGQLAVMSEFLHRRINVAIPEVDVGDDVFVVKGSDDTVTRIQVKAATATAQAGNYFARFNVPLAQLLVPRDTPALVYVFAVRFQDRWSDFIVIRRSTLFARVNEGAGYRGVSSDGKEYVQFRIVFTEEAVQCGPVNFQRYRNAWDPWPPPQLEEEEAPAQAQGDTGDAGSPGETPAGANLREQSPPPGGPTSAAPSSG
jgi:hypothetical protein